MYVCTRDNQACIGDAKFLYSRAIVAVRGIICYLCASALSGMGARVSFFSSSYREYQIVHTERRNRERSYQITISTRARHTIAGNLPQPSLPHTLLSLSLVGTYQGLLYRFAYIRVINFPHRTQYLIS